MRLIERKMDSLFVGLEFSSSVSCEKVINKVIYNGYVMKERWHESKATWRVTSLSVKQFSRLTFPSNETNQMPTIPFLKNKKC